MRRSDIYYQYPYTSMLLSALNQKLETNFKKSSSVIVSGPPFLNDNIHWGTYYNMELKNFYQIINYILYNRKIYLYRGFDIHGLPTDLKVLNLLKISKKDAFKNPVKLVYESNAYVKACKAHMCEQINMCKPYQKINEEQTYATNTKTHYECVWRVYDKLKKKGLIYYTLKCNTHCIYCVSGLANIEVETKIKKSKGWYYKFKLINYENTYIIVWTTSYWTIPGTVGIGYNPNGNYTLWSTPHGEAYIMSSALPINLRDLNLEFVRSVDNMEILNMRYTFDECIHKVVPESWVQTSTQDSESITGFVNLVPLYSENDLEYAIRNSIKCTPLIDEQGYYVTYFEHSVRITDYEYIKSALNEGILKEILLEREFNVCYRCSNSTIELANYEYFLKITPQVKSDILRACSNIIYNDRGYLKNFENWIIHAHDWCISRSRIFGIPIPELKHKSFTCFEDLNISSVDELYNLLPTLQHTGRVFDCWFESGCVNIASFEKFKVPSEYFIEGCDQIRGWLYTSSVLFMYIYGTLPYINVHIHGFLLQDSKTKLSKSKLGKDYSFKVQLDSVLNKYGIQALKLYTHSIPDWTHAKFNISQIAIYEKKWKIIQGLILYFSAGSHRKFGEPMLLKDTYYYNVHRTQFCDTAYLCVINEIIHKLDSCYDAGKRAIFEMDTKAYTQYVVDTLVNKISRKDLKILKKCSYGVMPQLKYILNREIYTRIEILVAPFTGEHIVPYKKLSKFSMFLKFLRYFPIYAFTHESANCLSWTSKNWTIWKYLLVYNSFFSRSIIGMPFYFMAPIFFMYEICQYISLLFKFYTTKFDYKKVYRAYEEVLSYKRLNNLYDNTYILMSPNMAPFKQLTKCELSAVVNACNILLDNKYSAADCEVYAVFNALNSLLKYMYNTYPQFDSSNTAICIIFLNKTLYSAACMREADLISRFPICVGFELKFVEEDMEGSMDLHGETRFKWIKK